MMPRFCCSSRILLTSGGLLPEEWGHVGLIAFGLRRDFIAFEPAIPLLLFLVTFIDFLSFLTTNGDVLLCVLVRDTRDAGPLFRSELVVVDHHLTDVTKSHMTLRGNVISFLITGVADNPAALSHPTNTYQDGASGDTRGPRSIVVHYERFFCLCLRKVSIRD